MENISLNYNLNANINDGSCIVEGSIYQGGIVFYLNGNGGGLIAAPSDQADAEWGCYGTDIYGSNGLVIGTGAQNTIDIVNSNCSSNTPGNLLAANICDTLTVGGYNDWFLHSKEELYIMYTNLHLLNLGNFVTNNYYKSSSEINSSQSWG